MDGFAERGTGVRLVQLGPQQADQSVATMEAARRRQREVGEERLPLGLGQYRLQRLAVTATQLETTKRTEVDQRWFLRGCRIPTSENGEDNVRRPGASIPV